MVSVLLTESQYLSFKWLFFFEVQLTRNKVYIFKAYNLSFDKYIDA